MGADPSGDRVAKADALADDLSAFMRGLYRLRRDLLEYHAWLHVEAACVELTRARTALLIGRRKDER